MTSHPRVARISGSDCIGRPSGLSAVDCQGGRTLAADGNTVRLPFVTACSKPRRSMRSGVPAAGQFGGVE